MTDLGLMKYFLEIQMKQSKGKFFISQEKYVIDLLKIIYMSNCKFITAHMTLNEKLELNDEEKSADAKAYRSLVGCLIYFTNIRLDIMHSMRYTSRFMSK